MSTPSEFDSPAKWNQKPDDDGPGKYEGEPNFTYYYHGLTMESGQDEEYGTIDEHGEWNGVFILKPQEPYDQAILRDVPNAYAVMITEDNLGFVHGAVYTKEEYDRIVAFFAKENSTDAL